MRVKERPGPLMASGRTARPPGAAIILVGEVGALVAAVGAFLPWGAAAIVTPTTTAWLCCLLCLFPRAC
jgi:hypothetical protein